MLAYKQRLTFEKSDAKRISKLTSCERLKGFITGTHWRASPFVETIADERILCQLELLFRQRIWPAFKDGSLPCCSEGAD
jgi:hypothetical protein